MALYDLYTQFQTPLTEEESRFFPEAMEDAARYEADPTMRQVAGGFMGPGGNFTAHPVLQEHMGIAIQRAEAQFRGWPAMPEDAETPVRFPGVDPVGKYGVIDMRFAQRLSQVTAALESRTPEVRAYVQGLLDAPRRDEKFQNVSEQMIETAKKQRTLSRASKLCLEPEGRRMLYQQSRDIQTEFSVERYDKYLQGIEYAAGVKTGPVPQEVRQFYQDTLQRPLDLDMVEKARIPSQAPGELHVEFQNLDNKLLQQRFANPHNWGQRPPAPDKELVTLEDAAAAIPPYARATADRVLDPVFAGAEAATDNHISRGDLIVVDGKTIRETMFAQFQTSDVKDRYPNFSQFYKENVRQMSNELVASGLMAGKRVEAFVPDSRGRIPAEPVQITKTGYEPSPLKKVTLNAWERHFAKRGFYKEKAAKAVEYQRTMEARQRVQLYNTRAQFLTDAGTNHQVKAQFFSGWVAEHGEMPSTVPNGYSVGRSAATTLAVCALAREGRPMEDILDPTKLTAEKQAAGREVLDRLVAGDQKWIAQTFTAGSRAVVDQIDRMAQAIDITDPKQLYSPQARPLVFASRVGFDAFQEMQHCQAEIVAQAEAVAPGTGAQFYDDTRGASYNMGSYTKYMLQGLDAKHNLFLGDTNNTSGNVSALACEEYSRQLMAEQIKANPGAPRSSLADPQPVAALYVSLFSNEAFRSYVDAVETDPAQRTDLTRGLVSGSFQSRMKLGMDTVRNKSTFAVAPAPDADAKQARRTDALEQTVKQNQAAKPKGPAMGHR